MKFIIHYIKKTIFFFFKVSVKFRLIKISSYLLYINIRKLYFKNKEFKNIIVLEKSHGIEDIKIAYYKSSKKVNLFVLQRKFIQIIFHSFFKNRSHELRDNYYRIDDLDLKNKQDNYKKFLDKIIKDLHKYLHLSAIISFNFKYYAERELHEVCKNNKIKFIACHKECNVFDGEIEYYNKILKNVGRFQGDLITVYNQRYKDLLVQNDIFDSQKIIVTGMPRADIFYDKSKNKKEYVLILLVSTQRSLKYINEVNSTKTLNCNEQSLNWENLATNLIRCVLEVAKEFPKTRFVFKTKIKNDPQTLLQQKLILESNLQNCDIKYGGNSIKQIKNAKFIIGFNTTGLIEGVIANKKILMPFFNLENNKYKKKFLLNDYNLSLKANSLNQMKDLISKNILDENIQIDYDKIIKNNMVFEHVGNVDGNSSERLTRAIEELLN